MILATYISRILEKMRYYETIIVVNPGERAHDIPTITLRTRFDNWDYQFWDWDVFTQ